MKFINPLSILVAAVLTLTLVSCTTSQYASDENYERERPMGNRIYIDDPYRGTIVLERDPYSGRYYDVTPGYGNRNYSSYGYNPYRSNVYYRNNDRVSNTQNTQQTEDRSKAREEARKKVLGN